MNTARPVSIPGRSMPAHKRQRGFTLVELMIGIAVVGILLYLVIQGLGGQQDTARASQARAFFVEDMPGALTSYGSSVGQTTNVSSPGDITAYGVSPDTAWGDSWTINSAGNAVNGVTIDYPIGGSRQDELGQNMATFLTSQNSVNNQQFPYLSNVSYSNGTLTATISQF